MDAIERRSVLRGILCLTATAGFAASSLPTIVEAMPLAPQKDIGSKEPGSKDLGSKSDGLTVQVQAVPGRPVRPPIARPPRRPVARPRRRPIHRRRWVCWWHRGRRVCGWR